MSVFKSSIGRKLIQAVSGAFLILFLLLHAAINFLSVIDSFTGKYGVVADDTELFSKGDGLFKLGCDFMSLPIIDIMVPVLALGIMVHIIYGCILTAQNIKARGKVRYEVSNKGRADSWSARNMFVLGMIILGILLFHLHGFWAKMQLPEMFGIGNFENNPYLLLDTVFGNWWPLLFYLIWFAAIWLHLVHGFWSMFQSVGWNNLKLLKRLKIIGVAVASLICLAFTAVAVNAFVHANAHTRETQEGNSIADTVNYTRNREICLTAAQGYTFSGTDDSNTVSVRVTNSGRRTSQHARSTFRVVKSGKIIDNNHQHPFMAVPYAALSGMYLPERYLYSICRLRL